MKDNQSLFFREMTFPVFLSEIKGIEITEITKIAPRKIRLQKSPQTIVYWADDMSKVLSGDLQHKTPYQLKSNHTNVITQCMHSDYQVIYLQRREDGFDLFLSDRALRPHVHIRSLPARKFTSAASPRSTLTARFSCCKSTHFPMQAYT